MSEEKLKEYNIIKKGSGCSCGVGKNTFRYTLPQKLSKSIIDYLTSFGEPCFNFNQIGFLKIENPTFCISGLKNNFFISFFQKKPCPEIIDKFEENLILYVLSFEKGCV
jgi:hypothetical protein